MTAAALLAAQAAIHASIQTRAAELGHDMAKVEPIYAVVDVHAWRGRRLQWRRTRRRGFRRASGWTRSSKPPQAAASAKPAVNMTV